MKIIQSITAEQWYSHPTFRQDLEVLLSNPVFLTALGIVQARGLKSSVFGPGIDLRDYFALNGAKKDGYFEALTNLVDLSNQPKAARPPDRPPWSTPRPGADGAEGSAP